MLPLAEKKERKVETRYRGLTQARESSVGYTTALPGEPTAIESELDVREIELRYSDLSASNGKILRFIEKIKPDTLEENLVVTMEETTRKYKTHTFRRLKHGLISPIAFCDPKDLPKHLGVPESRDVFVLTWVPQYQHFESNGAEMLEAVGVSTEFFMQWQSMGRRGASPEDTKVWTDLKALAFHMVCILDKTIMDGNEKTSGLLLMLVRQADLHRRITSVVHTLKALSLNVIRLVILRPADLNGIVQLFELILPATFLLNCLLEFTKKNWEDKGEFVLSELESYLSNIVERKEMLAAYLGTSEELVRYEELDNAPLKTETKNRSKDDAYKQEVPRALSMESRLFEEALQELRAIGLDEVDLDYTSKAGAGSGSFSNVHSVLKKGQDKRYAVKFLKRGSGSPKRIKDRLLREARIWFDLQHKNINVLYGFFAHPEQEFPGLVSALCEKNLHDYLEDHRDASETERLQYLLDASEGLLYMHDQKKICHGDVRPNNILLLPQDIPNAPRLRAVLNDFGVSDSAENIEGHQWTTAQHTNVYYLAPELLHKKMPFGAKKERRVTIKGDIYAFGCTIFVVIYGKELFFYDQKNYMKIKRKGGFPARERDLNERDWDLLRKTWDSDVEQRMSTVDLVEEIGSML